MGLKMLERNKEKTKDVLYRVTMECRNGGKTEILESYMQRGKYICKGNGMEMDFCIDSGLKENIARICEHATVLGMQPSLQSRQYDTYLEIVHGASIIRTKILEITDRDNYNLRTVLA